MAKPPFIVIPYEPVSVTLFASTPLASRPASHLAEYLYPGMIWQMASPATQASPGFDLGTVRPIDFAAMLSVSATPSMPNGQFLTGTGSGLEGNIYGGPLTPIPDIAQSPTPLSGQFHHFDYPALHSARYVRWFLGSASAFTASAAFMVVGKRITFQRYAEHDWEVGVDDASTVSFTRDGVPDIAEGVIQRTLSFTMKWVSEAEYFDQVALLDQVVGRSKPVLICFDPEAGSRRQALTYFGLLRENPRNRRINGRAFERRFEILSFI